MSEIYIENDPYNWFDRLDKYENDIKAICNNEKDVDSIKEAIKTYFIDDGYDLIGSIDEEKVSRFSLYSEKREESLVLSLELDMNLYYLSLAIHNEAVKELSDYNTRDNPNEFFSMFLN